MIDLARRLFLLENGSGESRRGVGAGEFPVLCRWITSRFTGCGVSRIRDESNLWRNDDVDDDQ